MHGTCGMTDLTKLARGKPCMIRLPGICNRDPETTVPCHVRMIDVSGAGLKAPDIFIAFGCAACHAVVDGHARSTLTYEQRRLALLEAWVHTLLWLTEAGHVTIKGERDPRALRLPKILPRRLA